MLVVSYMTSWKCIIHMEFGLTSNGITTVILCICGSEQFIYYYVFNFGYMITVRHTMFEHESLAHHTLIFTHTFDIEV